MLAFLSFIIFRIIKNDSIHEYLESFFFGLIFGAGLMISQLCDRRTIYGFLILNKDSWDPTFGLVFIAAILINFLTYSHILSGSSPMFGSDFQIPKKTGVNLRLLIGAGLFGLGWGLTGLDPATAFINMFLSYHVVFYVIAFALGQFLAEQTTRFLRRKYNHCDSEESLLGIN